MNQGWRRAGIAGAWLAGCLLALGLVARGACAADAEEETKPSEEEVWSVIYFGKTRVGYSRSVVKNLSNDGREFIRSENESYMVIKRFGQELKTKTLLSTDETKDGELLTFTFSMQNPPNSNTLTVGTVAGTELLLETKTGAKTSRQKLKWDPAVKSPAYQDRLLREKPLQAGEKRSFSAFMPEVNKVATITLNAREETDVSLLDGSRKKLLQIDMTQSILPGIVTKAWVDAAGETVKTSTSFLGTEMATYTVPRDEALKSLVGAELDLAVETLVKVKPIEDAHLTTRVVYRLKIPGEDPLKLVPAGPTQAVKAEGPDTALVTVTALSAPEPEKEGPRVAAEFVQSTRFLQSDDPRVMEHARAAVGDERDPWKQALLLEKYVHEKLTEKNFSTALGSAAEVAESLEGDCTEHACLLAAMARAEKIPSRIVVGLVYAKSYTAFGGHMWTELHIHGKWVPMDATLGKGGIGAAHLKLGDSSFTDDGPTPVSSFLPLLTALGKIQIEVVEVSHK